MSKPSEFYVGILDCFAILLPGAIATAMQLRLNIAALLLTGLCCNSLAQDAPAPKLLGGMDWMTAEDNRPKPIPVAGGLFEPMDWSVLDPRQPLRLEPLTENELKQLLASKMHDDLPHCVAAVYLNAADRPFIVHAYGRMGGGNGFIKINGGLRSASGIPAADKSGLFSLMTMNFAPASRFEDWRSSAMTNPLPATLLLTFNDVKRLPGTQQCHTSQETCRRYTANVSLAWHQSAMMRDVQRDAAGKHITVHKPGDPVVHDQPAVPSTLKVEIEDPCWGTRDAFVEAYASRVRLFEYWNRWTN